ncbi:Major heat shock 70 kDa protein Ab [Hypsibius exemplaris]|uniref:Major heat shock 70 kDa protein Ab n=1 Tax=Hypsibius exemplaris TaxID=2072580 RepID=A0A9X6NEL7_HYPEX|nr:Major heat shock 70 kDa protein Ab [Hypsibius exemplaris]
MANNIIGVGIDLGTTNCSVAVCYSSGAVDIIPNDQTGHSVTPSYVAFEEDGQILFGVEAKNCACVNIRNTVFEVKRILGRSSDDPEIGQNTRRWPFTVVLEKDGPEIEVEQHGEAKRYTPTQISSLVLSSLRRIASDYLGFSVKDVVVTVPANFNQSQRKETSRAAQLAGFNVPVLVNEPSAAAVAYRSKAVAGNRFLVFDFGGGTLDVSLVRCHEDRARVGGFPQYEVLASEGDAMLGGADFDGRLQDHLVGLFQAKAGFDVRGNAEAMGKLRLQAEMVKQHCTGSPRGRATVAALASGVDLKESVTREKFEELCADLFARILPPVERVLRAGGCKKTELDFVLLVGGSTRIPKVKATLAAYFGTVPLKQDIHPDEAIAYGAAVIAHARQAERVASNQENEDDVDDEIGTGVTDIVPATLGVEVEGGAIRPLIHKGRKLPVSVTETFATAMAYSTTATIKIYEGESLVTAGNKLLSQLALSSLTLTPHGQNFILVTFHYDLSGILKVTAKDTTSGKNVSVVLFE